MRLLVVTQKVDKNDDVLGFFHEWLKHFAERVERVEVICLHVGEYDLPSNVAVYSLGKESGVGRFTYLARLFKLIFTLPYDAVFVHMNPEYVVLCGWWWRLARKRVVLWYAHRQINLKLRLAIFFSNVVATAAPESLRVQSRKVRAIGHGIDTARFASITLRPVPTAMRLVSVGRLTPIKDLETMIDAILLLRRQGIEATLTLVGAPAAQGDAAYARAMQTRAAGDHGAVLFAGSVPNSRMNEVYVKYDVALNACPTGGVDKAVLEAMASGLPTLAANEAFRPYFGRYADALIFKHGDAQDLAAKIRALPHEGIQLQTYMREQARTMGDVAAVVNKLVDLLN